ncbi:MULTISPECIES: hypothetical protein [Chryseobacterium]|uniref:hypothetical protein n=1 Tax=Chryseobacterium TaxID=59732 RepID=UPI001629E333|nr:MULTISPECIES: hypothetical protein [Chryseobacterium]MDM1555648.1 hypothetical protein [Chryseobacterium indologenes]
MKIVNMTSKYLWIFLMFMSSAVFSQEQNYIPYRKGKAWGLCDPSKFITVQPQYSSISWYDESVKGFPAEQNGKFGIISANATVVMPFISDRPITVDKDKFLVFDGWDYYYYSMTTRVRLEKQIPNNAPPVNDRGWEGRAELLNKGDRKEVALSWDDLSNEDIEMLNSYDNDQYDLTFKRDFIEIGFAGGDAYIGIYIPKLRKFFFNTPELAHIGWQYYKGVPYIYTMNTSNLMGLVDVYSREVYPNKYHEIVLVDEHHLVYLSETDPNHQNNLIFKTILPNNKILDGKFEPAMQLWKNGNPFQLYYTIINGKKNYAGEDGTLYFEG